MKKQKSSIKAQIIRSAFYVLLLLAVCAIPFALAQSRNRGTRQSGNTFTVNLPTPAVLTTGTYWMEIQANMTFSIGGEWGWTDRTVQSNNGAAWQNPGGGFGICMTWGRRGDPAGCNIDPGVPDQVFRLNGSTCTPNYTFASSTGATL